MLKSELIETLDDIGEIIDNEDLTPSEKVDQIDDLISEDEEGEDNLED
jgi:hypothetical protein